MEILRNKASTLRETSGRALRNMDTMASRDLYGRGEKKEREKEEKRRTDGEKRMQGQDELRTESSAYVIWLSDHMWSSTSTQQ